MAKLTTRQVMTCVEQTEACRDMKGDMTLKNLLDSLACPDMRCDA